MQDTTITLTLDEAATLFGVMCARAIYGPTEADRAEAARIAEKLMR